MADTVELRGLEAQFQNEIAKLAEALGPGGERQAKALRSAGDALMLQAKCAVEWAVSETGAEEIATAEGIVERAQRQIREAITALEAALAGPKDQFGAAVERVSVQLRAEAESARTLRKAGRRRRLGTGAPATDWGAILQSAIFMILALVVLIGIGYGLFRKEGMGLDKDDLARGVITFLVTITAVAIAIILTLAATVSRADELEKRISLGKEMLTALIGVLGTIVGFYFGAAKDATSTPANAPAINAPASAPGAPGNGSASPILPGPR